MIDMVERMMIQSIMEGNHSIFDRCNPSCEMWMDLLNEVPVPISLMKKNGDLVRHAARVMVYPACGDPCYHIWSNNMMTIRIIWPGFEPRQSPLDHGFY